MDGVSAGSLRARLVSHCLLIETHRHLVLVDTGYGLRDVAAPRTRLNPVFLALMRPELREEMTAIRRIERLGFRATDVSHILLSHLDFDHAGGLDDFPGAQVYLFAEELESAAAQRTLLDRMRYRPQQWGTRGSWHPLPPGSGESWLGFSGLREVPELGSDFALVPLFGHTLGHAGVLVRQDEGSLFYAGDAYFYHAEMDWAVPRCTPGLRVYQRMMEKDRSLRLKNQERLRELRRDHPEITIFCSHDVTEFERSSGRSSRTPVGARGPVEPSGANGASPGEAPGRGWAAF